MSLVRKVKVGLGALSLGGLLFTEAAIGPNYVNKIFVQNKLDSNSTVNVRAEYVFADSGNNNNRTQKIAGWQEWKTVSSDQVVSFEKTIQGPGQSHSSSAEYNKLTVERVTKDGNIVQRATMLVGPQPTYHGVQKQVVMVEPVLDDNGAFKTFSLRYSPVDTEDLTVGDLGQATYLDSDGNTKRKKPEQQKPKPEEEQKPNPQQSPESGSGFWWWILGGGALVALLATLGYYLCVSGSNSGDEDSEETTDSEASLEI